MKERFIPIFISFGLIFSARLKLKNDCSILSKAERMSVTSVINCAGVNKEKFLRYTQDKGATYADWGSAWDQKTSGKEEELKSPYLQSEFEKAKEQGIIPEKCSKFGLIFKLIP